MPAPLPPESVTITITLPDALLDSMDTARKRYGFNSISEMLGVMWASYLPVLEGLALLQPNDLETATASFRDALRGG